MDVSGYSLEILCGDGELVLSRARSPDGAPSVLVLAPLAEQPEPAVLARLEREYALADELEGAWAARPLALVRNTSPVKLILEDKGGDPVDVGSKCPLDLKRFLHVAIGLAAAIGQVHRRGLIHKDIRPANVLVDAGGHVRLTGFGLATRLPRERQVPVPPEFIVGTLAYMAPEQTGRMNRSVDARSDLYAVGVTLYEMLTGTLPFVASDPMEWIHCHIARPPVPPRERTGGIPKWSKPSS